MSKRLSALLEDILASAVLVHRYVSPLSKDEFLASIQTQDAVLRRIEIIGEGVKNIPQTWRDAHPEIPWRQIARMRDTLIHRYFSIDLDIVWHTATQDIPELHRLLSALLDEVRRQEDALPNESQEGDA